MSRKTSLLLDPDLSARIRQLEDIVLTESEQLEYAMAEQKAGLADALDIDVKTVDEKWTKVLEWLAGSASLRRRTPFEKACLWLSERFRRLA